MNDRHRTIQLFYRRHHDLYMLEMMERIRKWTGQVYHEYLASVKVEKLKVNLNGWRKRSEDSMSDLISRQAAIDALREYIVDDGIYDMDENVQGFNDGISCAISELSVIPSAQPERKLGRWKIKAINTFELAYGTTAYEPVYECSLCGKVEESYLRLDEPIMPEDADFPKYCPNCGARMEPYKGVQNEV